jgi:hypothetical protein
MIKTTANNFYMAAVNTKLNSKLDTSKLDPKNDDDAVVYMPSKVLSQKENLLAQRNFILSSGFPLANNSRDYSRPLPPTFIEANAKYREFKRKEKKNQYLQVFEQNTASLIIRKYLLDKASNLSALKYYTEDLLRSHSENYSLIYLALKQLKPFVGVQKIKEYKKEINTDPIVAAHQKAIDALRANLIQSANSKSVSNNVFDITTTMANAAVVEHTRHLHYLRKLNGI